MNQLTDFFKKLLDSSDWPPRWHCGNWTEFHGWLYIISDLLIWSAYFAIPVVIIKYITRRQDAKFVKLYFFFAAFILACGATHFLDAIAFWIPVYRLSALVRFVTGVISWITVYNIVKLLPVAFSLKSQQQLEAEVEQRKKAEQALGALNATLEDRINERTAALQSSEKQYRYLFMNNPMPMWIVDTSTFRFLDVNDAAVDSYGYSREEFLSMTSLDMRPDDEKRRFMQTEYMSTIGESTNRGIWKHIKKDGSMIYADIAAHDIIFEGKTARFILANDITENIKAQQELIESQRLLQAIINNSTTVIYVKALDGRYILVNDRYAELFHVNKDEIIGKTDYEVFPKEYADAFREVDVRVAKSDKPLTEQEVAPHDDGMHNYISVKSRLKNNAGEPYAIFGISTDITEFKRVEENLLKSLQETSDYKYALDESAIVAITDQKGIIKHVNQQFCRISKYSADELIGQDHRIINSGYHSKEFIRNLWVTIANGNVWRGELKNKAKDRTYYWVDTTIVPFLNDKGKPYQYVAIRADITERKLAEENLKKLLKEVSDYKYALDESSIVAITDQKGIIKYANENFCRISKYSAKELVGQDHRIINSGYHSKEFIRNLWVTIANGKIWKGELRNKAKDGTIYWVDTTIIPFLNEQGKPYQYVAIRADITERKKAEDALSKEKTLLRTLIDNLPDYIYVKDMELRHIINNAANIRLIGAKNEEETLGKTVFDYFDQALAEKYAADDRAILNNNAAVLNREEMIYNEKEEERWLLTTKLPLRDSNNATVGLVGISRDITEIKKAEKEIYSLNNELEKRIQERTADWEASNKELEAFSYSVSHDLRAPLRAISGFATILKEDYGARLDEEGNRILETIMVNAGKMGRLIDDLLQFSKLGKKALSYSIIDMTAMATSCVEELLQRENADLYTIDIKQMPAANADAAMIRQVWLNVISNAIKYSSKKERPVIEIGAEEKNGSLVYFIKDNGAGFDMQYANKLFGVFQRLHSEEAFEGTGVGLALVHRIISKHKGRIWAEAAVNKGASFYFYLPNNHFYL